MCCTESENNSTVLYRNTQFLTIMAQMEALKTTLRQKETRLMNFSVCKTAGSSLLALLCGLVFLVQLEIINELNYL